ncbi:hypothetical protein BST27_10460 [Mycobacterium intermedium]|uniref:Uncharacterized protein n=1 Tax=Mycobacterium intermedium TaxID=28445 RepID=A0A1E3SLV8_MYCIE|nr:DMT family transporter [Mycobacterium intermedium]MCV6964736.1 DMT family transporter [Mycobacterium intermedium]ODR03092.1 hypothetical protein BHQ20_01485 [Mycobacterium intermedium]OPE49108.1 hypothetical protein BV508_15555 [Mycobacterium intermedium]ORB06825.1 hypothetical protein BST27_10460 [Mycobacterium intermedium]
MARTDLAVVLAVSSALCIATGDVLQQQVAHRITDKSVGQLKLLAKLLGNRRWRWGTALLAASIALQAAALGQGSVILVQALLMLSLLFALPISAVLSRRKMTASQWIWAGLLTAAVTVVVVVGHPEAGHSGASLRTWAVVSVVLGPALALCVVAAQIRRGTLGAVLFALVSGSLWGVFAVLTKEVVARLGDGGGTLIRTPELYACILVALGGILWSQSAFRAGSLAASMPTLQVSQPVVATVLGVLVLDEKLNTGGAGFIALAVAGLVMVAAIVKLAGFEAMATRDRAAAERKDPVSQPT